MAVAFLTVAFLSVALGEATLGEAALEAADVVCAVTTVGNPTATEAERRQISRNVLKSRVRVVTGKPL